jgi:hypothetical protein
MCAFRNRAMTRASALDSNDSAAPALVAPTAARLLIKLEGDGATPQAVARTVFKKWPTRAIECCIARKEIKRIMEDNLTTSRRASRTEN